MFIERGVDVVGLRSLFQHVDEVPEFAIVGVVKPTGDWQRVAGLKQVGRWAVVDDDRLVQRPSQIAQILYVIAVQVCATVAEQSAVHPFAAVVQLVDDWVGVDFERSSEDDNLKQLTHSTQKFVHEWAFANVDGVCGTIQFDVQEHVNQCDWLER